jgi:hypothetical protein
MEVPHHRAHAKESSKSWKSNLGEFLMLFLAVFSGFIAENLRENYVEKERAHQYVTSMVSDLQKDTLQLQRIINANKRVLKGIDTLLFNLKEPASDSVLKKIYIDGSFVAASTLFENFNGTITQLKNAGGLRLIKDTAVVNFILAYDQFNERIKKQGDVYYKTTLEIINVMEDIMDFSIVVKRIPKPVFFLSKNADKLRYFYNKCYMQQQIISQYAALLGQQKREAVAGITLLRKHYHIK